MITPISYRITPIQPAKEVSFGAKAKWYPPYQMKQADIKKLWQKGKLPEVVYGFYGDTLTMENVTREHLLPASQGGTRRFGNIVLASKDNNGKRGAEDINNFAKLETVKQYLRQFNDIKLPNFDGQLYIQTIKKTLKMLGFPIK